MAKYKTIDQVKIYDIDKDNIGITFYSDYVQDENIGVKSNNGKHGADFNAMDDETDLSTSPALDGYIKNGILHFSIMELRQNPHANSYFGKHLYILLPTNLELVHKIMADMYQFGRKHHLSKYAHLGYKIDWVDAYKRYDIHLKGYSKNVYKKALEEYLPFNSLQRAKQIINNNLNGESQLTNNKYIRANLIKAKSSIQRAIFMERHYQFQKSQKNDNLKA